MNLLQTLQNISHGEELATFFKGLVQSAVHKDYFHKPENPNDLIFLEHLSKKIEEINASNKKRQVELAAIPGGVYIIEISDMENYSSDVPKANAASAQQQSQSQSEIQSIPGGLAIEPPSHSAKANNIPAQQSSAAAKPIQQQNNSAASVPVVAARLNSVAMPNFPQPRANSSNVHHYSNSSNVHHYYSGNAPVFTGTFHSIPSQPKKFEGDAKAAAAAQPSVQHHYYNNSGPIIADDFENGVIRFNNGHISIQPIAKNDEVNRKTAAAQSAASKPKPKQSTPATSQSAASASVFIPSKSLSTETYNEYLIQIVNEYSRNNGLLQGENIKNQIIIEERLLFADKRSLIVEILNNEWRNIHVDVPSSLITPDGAAEYNSEVGNLSNAKGIIAAAQSKIRGAKTGDEIFELWEKMRNELFP